jgi:hypothetical protein
MSLYMSGKITAPGGVTIPVCSVQEVFGRWHAEFMTKKNFRVIKAHANKASGKDVIGCPAAIFDV